MRGLWLWILTAALAGARPGLAAFVTTAADLCPAAADPCMVTKSVVAAPGAELDLGERALVFGSGGVLDVGASPLSISARSLWLQSGARLLGTGGTITVATSGLVRVDATARIDVAGTRPGRVVITAGEVRVDGQIAAHALDPLDGGAIEIRGGKLAVGRSGRLRAGGGTQGVGGLVVVGVSGELQIDGPVEASGGDSGGSIEIEAGSVATTAALDVSGGPGGTGAYVDIVSRGAVRIGGPISGQAGGSTALGGGSGAMVSIAAAGPVEVTASITANGAAPAGQGGTVEIATEGDFAQRAAISAAGRGTDGVGGEVSIGVAGEASFGGIDVRGGTSGGSLTVWANRLARLTGAFVADGALEGGSGGAIEVRACDVDMDTAASLSAQGPGGRNTVQASGQLVLRGALVAGDTNVLEYRDAAVAPIVVGALTPLVAPVVTPTLAPCGQLGPGATTTTTLPGPPPGECVGGGLAGIDAALCRLSAIRAELAAAPPEALGGRAAARRLRAKAAKVVRLLEGARKARKPARKLRGAYRHLGKLLRRLEKGVGRGRIEPALGARVAGLGEGAMGVIEELLR